MQSQSYYDLLQYITSVLTYEIYGVIAESVALILGWFKHLFPLFDWWV